MRPSQQVPWSGAPAHGSVWPSQLGAPPWPPPPASPPEPPAPSPPRRASRTGSTTLSAASLTAGPDSNGALVIDAAARSLDAGDVADDGGRRRRRIRLRSAGSLAAARELPDAVAIGVTGGGAPARAASSAGAPGPAEAIARARAADSGGQDSGAEESVDESHAPKERATSAPGASGRKDGPCESALVRKLRAAGAQAIRLPRSPSISPVHSRRDHRQPLEIQRTGRFCVD